MSKLPFNRSIFWKVFVVVLVLVVGTFAVLAYFTSYERTDADTYGSLISALILAYLVHLWLLPAEYVPDDEYEEEPEDAEAEAAAPPASPAEPTEDKG